MNGWSIAGISVAVIGILVIILGAMLQSINLSSPDFMSFATGGIIVVSDRVMYDYRITCYFANCRHLVGSSNYHDLYIQLAGYRFCYQSDWFYSYYRTGFLGIF